MIYRMTIFLAAIFSLMYSTTEAASFDCSKASSTIEHLICDDPKLSGLDSDLLDVYKKALASSTNPNALKVEQRSWITQQRNKCSDAICLQSEYLKRISELNSISPSSSSKTETANTNIITANAPSQPITSTIEKQPAIASSSTSSVAGIDNITSYQSPPAKVDTASVQPYTIQDIIKILPNSLNKDGVYEVDGAIRTKKNAWQTGSDLTDPRAVAFDEENFGKCKEYYIHVSNAAGGRIFSDTLKYLFAKNEDQKVIASREIKDIMRGLTATVPNHNNAEYRSGGICENWEKYNTKLNEILNDVIQAAPAILQERHRTTEIEAKENEALIIKHAQDEKDAAEKHKSDSLKGNFFIFLAVLGGAWVWHKFIRRRCPSCKATSPEVIDAKELDSWVGTKEVKEDLGNGKSRTRHINTTFSKIKRTYKCKSCGNEWDEVSKEEKG